jgi:protein-L-isoaspartate(D-aspartate) O-methyltransferase
MILDARQKTAVLVLTLVTGTMTVACDSTPDGSQTAQEPIWDQLRAEMVERIRNQGVRDELVLQAMNQVPRHLFGLEDQRERAYDDASLPIGDGQSTPEPYMVALMAELLEVSPGERVLEIGTGSGYQAAVLASMGAEVYSIEIRPRLCERATQVLKEFGYTTAHIRCGDGYNGWPEEGPFDGILVTAAPEEVPEPLLDQLHEGGKMVIPVGPFYQDLKLITRTADGLREQSVIPVRFKGIDRSGQDQESEESE